MPVLRQKLRSWSSFKRLSRGEASFQYQTIQNHTLPKANSAKDCKLPKEKIYPIYDEKDERTLEMAAILLFCIKSTQPDILVEYKEVYSDDSDDETFVSSNDKASDPVDCIPGCYAKGCNLISWLQDLLKVKQRYAENEDPVFKCLLPPTRRQICGMWQVLLEEGALCHVKSEEHFEDWDFYYCFHKDVINSTPLVLKMEEGNTENQPKFGEKSTDTMMRLMPFWIEGMDLLDILSYLKKYSHDASFRKALRKKPLQRGIGELKMIYEELLHFNSIAHLTDTVKRELARVLMFEYHAEADKVLFNQGDEGTCWYIILRGSVKVDVMGKGIVCTLQEGDDFGSLALMNNAPRSATIILAEPNCQLIRVEKSDYFRILKDVEENTLRLKEHGKDVLILEKVSTGGESADRINGQIISDYGSTPRRRAHSYSITAGTPERILEHILEYLQPWKITFYDETLENFILMFATFMKSDDLFRVLLDRYRSEDPIGIPFERSMRRKIVYFIVRWSYIVTYLREDDIAADIFLKEMQDEVEKDGFEYPEYAQLREELGHVYQVNGESEEYSGLYKSRIYMIEENVRRYQQPTDIVEFYPPLLSTDQTLMKIYNSEQTYTTVKLPLSATTEEIIESAAEKLYNNDNETLMLVEAMENGDRIELPMGQKSIATSIGLNSCLCVCESRDSFELKKEPRMIGANPKFHFDEVSSMEIAYYITMYDWHLMNNVHILEYVYKVFGHCKFQRITPNLDVLARRFNQLAYWPATEICTCPNVNKRAILLRKFIKIAQHLKQYQNMNAFMALMIGIGNQAVSRMHGTWEKLPAKYKKLVQEFETILDPSRNHHSYRVFANSMEPPYIPYFPLLMRDMTFQHEGNDNQKQELVNFEKMQMISTSIRTIIRGLTAKIEEDSRFSSSKALISYVQTMQVITNQRTLNDLSNQLEPKRTTT